MFGKLGFYLRHSFNDLRVNGQRTLFALLCIAAGVAAIVSLQTLGEMIRFTLSSSLQESNQGDIRIEASLNTFGADEGEFEQVGEDQIVTPGNGMGMDYFSEENIVRIQAWLDENFPGEVELAYQHVFGGLPSASAPEQETTATFVTPYVVDKNIFPFYGEVTDAEGRTLPEFLQVPTDIAIDRTLAQKLNADVGDTIRLPGATSDFTVTAIINETTGGFSQVFASLFGYYYLDLSALELFPEQTLRANILFWRLNDPVRTVEISDAFEAAFPYLEVTNTEDLREENAEISGQVLDLVSVMGLLSLLIGGIGIINTMQVIVRRRTTEIAVLKTIGLEAPQVTTLFLVEAFLMGVFGSILGILAGWALTFLLRGAAGAFLGQDLPFRLTPGPAITGLIVGTLVTTVFGFLPTLSAGQVRPGLVLRPQDTIIPRAGVLRSLLAVAVVIVALIIIAAGFIGPIAAAIVPGAFIIVGILYLLLSLLIWLVGRFVPTFGSVDLKVALRSMLASRARGASTLLALAVGVFTLSLITLLTGTILGLFQQILVQETGGNVIVFAPSVGDTLGRVESILDEAEGVNSYAAVASYTTTLVTVQDGETGQVETLDEIKAKIDEAGVSGPAAAFVDEDFRPSDTFDFLFQGIDARDVTSNLPEVEMVAGRQLTAEDAGRNVIVLTENDQLTTAGIGVGDQLTLAFESPRLNLFGLGADDPTTATFEVVGVRAQGLGGFNSSTSYAPTDAFPENVQPASVNAIVDVEEAQIGELRRELETVIGIFVIETRLINDVLNQLIQQFTSFPIIVAALSLIVGGIVIANSVALATLERRREIAIMKSVGLQRERVLGMLLLENGLMGLIGGLIGVGIGLVILLVLLSTAFTAGNGAVTPTVPYGTAVLLMLLCVVIALVAATFSAWGASGEKPLNVLRYE
ncbi:MAG: FtsX-like permease family protein [bacterium]|nr:FtsX-like permease family protein [bacterium]